MELQILGPLAVRDSAVWTPGNTQLARLLAALLLAEGRPVAAAELPQWLWDGEPPDTARLQVHKLVSALRRRLPGRVETVGTGYRLLLDAGELDAARFQQLSDEGSRDALRQALGLWRGPALQGLDGTRVHAAATRWDERRLAVLTRLVRLELDDEAASSVELLTAEVTAHPLREDVAALLMSALSADGRTADALQVFAELRERLREQLGVDPSEEVRALHVQLLRGEHRSGHLRDASRPRPDAGHAPRTLPYDTRDFTGRAAELAELEAAAASTPLLAIDGMPGVGKTALAVHLAHRLAEQHGDGQLFLDLQGHRAGREPVSAGDATEALLRSTGLAQQAIPDSPAARRALWQSWCAQRSVVVVLDNAVSHEQIRDLLPGTERSLTIVTSRARLVELAGAHFLSLEPLDDASALDLVHRIATGPTSPDPSTRTRPAGSCAGAGGCLSRSGSPSVGSRDTSRMRCAGWPRASTSATHRARSSLAWGRRSPPRSPASTPRHGGSSGCSPGIPAPPSTPTGPRRCWALRSPRCGHCSTPCSTPTCSSRGAPTGSASTTWSASMPSPSSTTASARHSL